MLTSSLSFCASLQSSSAGTLFDQFISRAEVVCGGAVMARSLCALGSQPSVAFVSEWCASNVIHQQNQESRYSLLVAILALRSCSIETRGCYRGCLFRWRMMLHRLYCVLKRSHFCELSRDELRRSIYSRATGRRRHRSIAVSIAYPVAKSSPCEVAAVVPARLTAHSFHSAPIKREMLFGAAENNKKKKSRISTK